MNKPHLTLRRITIAWLPVALVIAPNAGAEPQVVLGAVTDSGAVGYGTERPAAISLGTCANAIHDTWSDWGGPTAHGEGTACQQSGTSPRYALIASQHRTVPRPNRLPDTTNRHQRSAVDL